MNSNLLLNDEKTKQMLITTPQMSRVHGLGAIVPPPPPMHRRKGAKHRKSHNI